MWILPKPNLSDALKDVDEFELVSTPDNKNGNFVMDITEVVYGYKQKTFLVIKHLDKFSGEELEPTRTVNALHNDAYTTEKKTFDGYVYDRCGMIAERIKKNDNQIVGSDNDKYICKNCNNQRDISKVRIPYAFKLFIQYLQTISCNVGMKV